VTVVSHSPAYRLLCRRALQQVHQLQSARAAAAGAEYDPQKEADLPSRALHLALKGLKKEEADGCLQLGGDSLAELHSVSRATADEVERHVRCYLALQKTVPGATVCEGRFLNAEMEADGHRVMVRTMLQKVEMDMVDGEAVFTVVDYVLGFKPVDQKDVEDQKNWAELERQAWILMDSGEYCCAKVGIRLFYLDGAGGSTESKLLSHQRLSEIGLELKDCYRTGRSKELENWSFQLVLPKASSKSTPSSSSSSLKSGGRGRGPSVKWSKALSSQQQPELQSAAMDTKKTKKTKTPVEPPPPGGGKASAAERKAASRLGGITTGGAVEDVGRGGAGPTVPVGTTQVSTPEEAERVLQILLSLRSTERFHAIDTETRGWERSMTQYGHGEVICWSVYCGDDVDFGSGPRLWVDNMDPASGQLRGLVEYFRSYLEDPDIQKVFQNYSFDRAMFFNHGIRVAGFAGDTIHMARLEDSDRLSYALDSLGKDYVGLAWEKTGLRDLMKAQKVIRPEGLHASEDPATRQAWIDYSTFDTVVTWKLHQELSKRLAVMQITGNRGSLLEFYNKFWRPFADVLAGIEERGVPIDGDFLQAQCVKAESEKLAELAAFKDFVRRQYEALYPDLTADDVLSLKLNSSVQMKHFIFGAGIKVVAGVRVGGLGLDPSKVLPKSKKRGSEVSMDQDTLAELCGRKPEEGESGCGTAFPFLGQEGCIGLAHKVKAALINKQVSTFLQPLQDHRDSAGRVHTSLNLRTHTGRLTSSNPNLQQLPAVDKDCYQVRKAVRSPPGKLFIISDYGQLDLRILAHMSNCPNMIDALSSDVDIHSSTAFNMYPHVRKAVESGSVVLAGSKDGSGPPAVKDVFATERRHAKAVNFGIAYGLTKRGLATQLGCAEKEAEEMITKWYLAYPEVKTWQFQVNLEATEEEGVPFVETLRGRRRHLAKLLRQPPAPRASRGGWQRKTSDAWWENVSAQRKATNSPVQGGSADVVVEAMLKASVDEELVTKLGYSMILQVHDELIFEGPAENAEAALAAVKRIMEEPFLDDFKLKVPLPVDAKIATSWHEAKNADAKAPSSPAEAEKAEAEAAPPV